MRTAMFLTILMFSSLFSGMSAGVMQEIRDGNDYDDDDYSNHRKIIDCTAISSPCDDNNSVVVGAYNYNSGNNEVIYELNLNGIAECIDSDLELSIDLQTNGPNNNVWGGVTNHGWVGGQKVHENSTTQFGSMSKVVIYAHDWDGNPSSAPSDWDMIDANSKVEFKTGNLGTISTTNRGTGFFAEEINLPKNGTVNLTGRTGTYLKTDTATGGVAATTSTLKIKLLNDPQADWTKANSHLRTEIRSVTVEYDDETVSPSNPSGQWSTTGSDSGFIDNAWTRVRKFTFTKTVPAHDDCQFDHLEYVILPSGSNPNTVQSLQSYQVTNNKVFSNVWVPSASTAGVYKFWYRAVDSLGNEAQWVTDSDFEIRYDRVAPVAGVTTVNYSSTIPWFSDSSLPSLDWSGWTDAHATIKNYSLSYDGSAPHVTGISNSTASWTASSSAGLTCGPHTFKLKAFDRAMPVANNRFVTVPFNFDNCAPNPASISLPSSNWYTSNSPSVDFTPASETSSAQSGIDHCELFVNGQSQGIMNSNLCISQTASKSINLLDGSYTGHMRTCDVAGNCANSTEEFIRIDTISPSLQATTLISPTANIWGSDSSLNLTLSFTDTNPGNTTISQMERAYAIVVPSSQVPTVGQMKNGTHYIECQTNSCSLDISQTLTDGNWSVWYLAYDQAGNVLGPNKVQSHFLVDTTAPTSTTPHFAANLTNQSSMTVLWTPSYDVGSLVANYYLNLTNTGTLVETSFFIGSNSSYLLSGLVDGNYSACLVPVDGAGNHGSRACTTTNLQVDTTAPTLQAWTDVVGWTSSNQATIFWVAEDDSFTAQVRYSLDNGSLSQPFPTNHSIVLSSLSAGIHHVLVIANDSAGNAIEVALSFGIDPTPPVIQAHHIPGQSWTNQSSHSISWNVTDSQSGVSNVAIFFDGTLLQDNVTSNGTWVFNLTSGTHNLSIIATNEVGLNSSWTSLARVDSATPSLTCSATPNSWTSTAPSFYFDVQLNGSVSNVVYVVKYDGNLMNVPVPGSVTLPSSLDGYHNVTVEASNQGGNTVACRVPVYIDSTAPVLLTYPQFPNVLNTSLFDLSLDLFDTHSGVSNVEISIGGVLLSDSAESNLYALDFTTFQDGEYDLQVKIVDYAANELHWNTTFTLDRAAPVIESLTLATPTLNGWLNQSTAKIDVSFSDLGDSAPTGAFVINGATYQASQGANYLPLLNGLNAIQFTASDHGGLVSSTTLEVNVDTVVPQCLLTGDTASTVWSKQLTRTLSNEVSSGPSGYTTSLEVNGLAQGQIFDSVLVQLVNGTNHVSALVVSTAGLSSTCSIQQLADAQPDPLALEIAPSNGQYGDGFVELRLNGSFGELSPGVARLLVNGEETETFSYNSNLDEFHVLELQTGSYAVSLETSDDAGNTWSSQSQIVSVLIDNLPPEVGCKFQTNGGTTILNRNAEMNALLFASGSKQIQCFVEDFQGNPIDFQNDIGEITVRYDGLPMSSLSTLDVTQNGFDFSLADADLDVTKPHELSVVARDMWGNTETQIFSLMFMRADRSVEIICVDELNGDDVCQVGYPLVDEISDVRLTFQAKQFIHIEPGFEWELLSESQVLSFSSDLVFEGTVQATSNNIIQIYILDLLRQNNLSFEERNRFSIQLQATTSYGQSYITSQMVEFEQCPMGYRPNHGTMKCEASEYLGPDLTWSAPETPLPRNTTQLQFEISNNTNAMTEISSTCRFGDQEIPIPNGAPKVPVKLNNTVLSVQLVCTDDNGFVKSTETYELTYEPPKMIEQGFLGSIPSEVLIGGGAVALLVLVAVGIMLSRKKDGVRSQDASQAIISEPQAISQILKDEPPESVPDVVQSPFLLPKENDFEMLLLEAERDTLAVTKPLELNEGGLNDEP
jgi:hypothetical protein